MDAKSIQAQFDVIKWYDSILDGQDRCGTYKFCIKCRKEQKYPCANAMNRYEKGYVRVAIVSRRKSI